MLATPSPPVKYGRAACSSAPVRGHGQGKTAATIVADQGDFVTIITDVPYSVRCRTSYPVRQRPSKGTRQMHQSTLKIPCQAHTDYTTTVQANFGGSKTMEPPERRYPFLSAQVSQIAFGDREQQPWSAHYRTKYCSKPLSSPRVLQLPAFNNKMSMTEGCGMQRAMTAPGQQGGHSYWTQYARIHNKLGVTLGPGVPRELPIRRSYNLITGEDQGPAWQDENKRISGNRVLYNGYRKDAHRQFVLG